MLAVHVDYFENYDLESVVTPVDADKLDELLKISEYEDEERRFIVSSFKFGFDLMYRGDENVQMKSPNLKFRGVGNETILWNKVMKEVKLKRYAGPYEEIPYDNFIQSPIGLVPKDNGRETRLIFHLSYPRNSGRSVNENTPREYCKVKYPDFSEAVKLCLSAGKFAKLAKSDVRSAFRNLGMSPKWFKFLIMKAKSPINGRFYYFIDKCLPFGSSISCSHYQRVSNCIAHIVRFRTQRNLVNYLDDYFFAALLKTVCDYQVKEFLKVCSEINLPISIEKTFWGATIMVFLGLLLNTESQTVSIPIQKIERAFELINAVLNKKSKKITVNQLQKICGFLNFLGRAIVPGRAFTRRLYTHLSIPGSSRVLKPHHHIRVKQELRLDLETWASFLKHPTIFCRSFMDFTAVTSADEIDMYSDATTNPKLGFGATCGSSFMYSPWNESFIRKNKPSIQYLELFAVVAGVLAWIHRFKNRRIILFCDNKSVVDMINANSTSCKKCMTLIRILVMKGLIENVRIFCKHVKSKDNLYADQLSRLEIMSFRRDSKRKFEAFPTKIPEAIWPMEKIWYTS